MRVLVTGSRGQVGSAVVAALADHAEVVAVGHATLDLTNANAVRACVRETKPALIVNAAAYTAVDKAEQDAATAEAVNAIAPGILAEEAQRLGAALIHYSTDYVFDGTKSSPYREDDPTNPLGVYGRTKLAGEQAIVASGCVHVILRTSWVYGPTGGNFLLTMLKLAATRPELRVVDDQIGAPTSSLLLARVTREIIERMRSEPGTLTARMGVFHTTARGSVSWCGFARRIFKRWSELSPEPFTAPKVIPIPASEYPTPARRPANSRLAGDKLAAAYGVRLESWEDGLEEVLRTLASR
ncbi:dTDP-4-dehydrorhamnose reductase [Usitatibacter palustris]|uniref:dTDP-4-dehydrorhamnose reductase n=1 Tax=Usitatibacter palustris TaxID=2732487 RepID=A0A6M4H1D6_9PROT|nr:dTDP-4-dehydrorhamnose reductase [Usitatibacter palustris]QJR13280.1 dTDP-4-dehydrorhamnose reductase [Usitatibacter palustris]